MKFRLPSFLLKSSLFFYNESDHGNRVELSAQKNWAQCSTQRPSAQYFRSIIQVIYHPSFKVAVSLTEDEALALAAELLSVVASRRGFQPESSDEEPE